MREPTLSGVADEVVVGEVSFVVFTNPSSGFGVVDLLGPEGELRAAGPLAGVSAGQPLRLVGRWVEHPRHGTTFEALYYELAPPERTEALAAFLASPRFTGVGERIAERLVEAFGLDLPEVIAREPEALARVRGVSPALAQRVAGAWREAGALAALVERLSVAGVPANIAQGAHRVFGDRAEAVLEEDPYRLLEAPAARWAHAESLARAAGLDAYDERRLAAGAATAHRTLRARGGHVAVATADLAGDTVALLGVDAVDARRGLDLAVAGGRLACDPGPEETAPGEGAGARVWYTPADLAAERGLAGDVARLAGARSRVAAAVGPDPDLDAGLVDEQAAAARTALAEPVSVLTGGPGTGKTRAIIEVVRACEQADLRVACAAPTGRAAKRVEELTGRTASTVHRLLDAQPRGDGGFAFTYGRQRRLPHDLLVVDEWSMADLHLAAAL
ncbi:MAG: AAA family ATPase, partial [Actinomycetota bacterium]